MIQLEFNWDYDHLVNSLFVSSQLLPHCPSSISEWDASDAAAFSPSASPTPMVSIIRISHSESEFQIWIWSKHNLLCLLKTSLFALVCDGDFDCRKWSLCVQIVRIVRWPRPLSFQLMVMMNKTVRSSAHTLNTTGARTPVSASITVSCATVFRTVWTVR